MARELMRDLALGHWAPGALLDRRGLLRAGASGLLDETLVVVTGEFGRTPKINPNAGRDHWPQVFSVLLAGAGLSGGRTFGSSDKQGASPAATPITSSELSATIFHALGIDPASQLTTQVGRPWQISEAKPVVDLWS